MDFQPFFKYILFISNKPHIEELFIVRSQIFWNNEHFDAKFIEADKNFHKLLRAAQLFLPFCFYIIFSFMLRPLFFGNMFIVETWIVESIIICSVVLALEYYLLLLIIPILVGYDCLYLSLCIYIIIELKRLNHGLKHMLKDTSKNSQKNLITLIKYHQHLIK